MDSETVKALLELKEKFNEIGHAYLQTKLPLELSQISEVLEPFIDHFKEDPYDEEVLARDTVVILDEE